MCDPTRFIESLPREKRRAAWLILGMIVLAMWFASIIKMILLI